MNPTDPAFPRIDSGSLGSPGVDNEQSLRFETIQGMTLRHYFAAAALQGVLANPQFSGLARHNAKTLVCIAIDAADKTLEFLDPP